MIKALPEKPLIRIDSEVTRRVRQHARAHMKTEVCGVLIGKQCDGIIEIEASIEALNAAQAGTHVTFTQDAWETIYKVKDESYPNERIVGWYHSHPGFGVFLSEHDTFIHQNFFSSPDQVAWVYDPHSDEEGCFGWVDGAIHRIANLSVADQNGDGMERPSNEIGAEWSDPDDGVLHPPVSQKDRRWISISVRFLSHLSALLLGFVIAYFLFPRLLIIPVDPATGRPLMERMQIAPSQTEPPPSDVAPQAPSNSPDGKQAPHDPGGGK
jgi:proteasome lid subunit RPN8/RPN11